MTTPAQAKTVVAGSAIATGVLTFIASAAENDKIPKGRTLIGITVAAVFLLALSGPAPAIASGFALLMLMAAMMRSVPGLRAITRAVGGTK